MQIHFFLYIHKMLLLVAKENKNVCWQVNSDERESLTDLVSGNAILDLPVVVSLQRDSSRSMLPKWDTGKSNSGWMNRKLFYEYACDIFSCWLEDLRIPYPVIIFIHEHIYRFSSFQQVLWRKWYHFDCSSSKCYPSTSAHGCSCFPYFERRIEIVFINADLGTVSLQYS